ncbi:hypothetical protein HY489_00930 [Candidatus Woesearchaeota archaeon]|nr:hypothetical protein [Candidatus Woesearchaeota archaeon]
MISSKANKIFEKIKKNLKGYEGKIIAIEVDSGDYFVGEDVLDAYEQGVKKHPGKEFFFKRVGAKTAFVVGAKISKQDFLDRLSLNMLA